MRSISLGHLLALKVTAANEQERAQVCALAADVQEVTGQSVELAYVDQGYTGEQAEDDAESHGIHLDVVKLPEAKRGFVLLPRRWVSGRFPGLHRRASGRLLDGTRFTVTHRAGTVLQEAVVDVDDEAHEVVLTLHWPGGVHTELRLPRRRRGTATRTSSDALDAVRILARVCADEAIAGFLNRNNLPTGRGNRWIKERVTALRSYHGIPCHSEERQAQEGALTLTAAAAFLGVSTRTLRLAAERGDIPGLHPLAVGPWVFTQSDLESQSARDMVAHARQRGGRDPAVPLPSQQLLGFSGT